MTSTTQHHRTPTRTEAVHRRGGFLPFSTYICTEIRQILWRRFGPFRWRRKVDLSLPTRCLDCRALVRFLRWELVFRCPVCFSPLRHLQGLWYQSRRVTNPATLIAALDPRACRTCGQVEPCACTRRRPRLRMAP